MGEEWRKGWHPEKIPAAPKASRVLVVGAGPAGLEAALALGNRGYDVMLAEATRDLGGRVLREAALPGMSEYIRVRDYREQQLLSMPNVEIFRESRMGVDDVLAVSADHVVLATGATWRADRFDGTRYVSVAAPGTSPEILTADDIMDGKLPTGPTLVCDDDGYYMGGVIAEKIRAAGIDVTLCTESDSVSQWAAKTSERWRIRTHLMGLGGQLELAQTLSLFDGKIATLTCAYTGVEKQLPFTSVVMVSQRKPKDQLWHDLTAHAGGDRAALPFTLKRIADCEAPAIIAAAVYAGHRYARELDADVPPLKHDRVDGDLPPLSTGA
ncbi:FAD/NAD(P)-binding oxidoreductase [Rhodobacteraceae bacterium KMM 6894]|nr:FAD/NAD(P)-binding oxidoreductase [Rhodobacteraceae bacterium KMM 6894]